MARTYAAPRRREHRPFRHRSAPWIAGSRLREIRACRPRTLALGSLPAGMPQAAIDRAGLDAAFRRAASGAATRSSVRSCATGRSCSTSSTRPRSCPPAGPTCRKAARYRLARRDDDALFGHNAGPNSWKSFLFPSELRIWTARQAADGDLEVTEDDTPPRATRSSACAPATCTRSPSRTASSWRAATSTRTTAPAARAPSSSRSTAARRPRPASASRWTPARRRQPASTSRSPRCSRRRHGFLVEVGSELGAEVLAELAHRDAEAARARGGRRARDRERRRRADARRSTPTASRSCSTATASTRAGTTWPTAA